MALLRQNGGVNENLTIQEFFKNNNVLRAVNSISIETHKGNVRAMSLCVTGIACLPTSFMNFLFTEFSSSVIDTTFRPHLYLHYGFVDNGSHLFSVVPKKQNRPEQQTMVSDKSVLQTWWICDSSILRTTLLTKS